MAKRKETPEVVEDENKLTPQQKAANTRKANKLAADKAAEEAKAVETSNTPVESNENTVTEDTEATVEVVEENKTEETTEVVETVKETEQTEGTVEVVETPEESTEDNESNTEEVSPVESNVEINVEITESNDDEIPYFPKDGNARILKALELHDTYETLYVDLKNGGLYDAKTFKKGMNRKAILYKNPYFKK